LGADWGLVEVGNGFTVIAALAGLECDELSVIRKCVTETDLGMTRKWLSFCGEVGFEVGDVQVVWGRVAESAIEVTSF
jgi:hypothetical protein